MEFEFPKVVTVPADGWTEFKIWVHVRHKPKNVTVTLGPTVSPSGTGQALIIRPVNKAQVAMVGNNLAWSGPKLCLVSQWVPFEFSARFPTPQTLGSGS